MCWRAQMSGKSGPWNVLIPGLHPLQVHIPIFLAGGLNASNVTAAIEQVGPFALDVCSGVRKNGKLDEEMLANFFAQIASGD